MRIINERATTNRKRHRCDACWRMFGKGVKMNVQTVADQSEIGTFRACGTCEKLLVNFARYFSEADGSFAVGCIAQSLEKNETPEDAYFELLQDRLRVLEDQLGGLKNKIEQVKNEIEQCKITHGMQTGTEAKG